MTRNLDIELNEVLGMRLVLADDHWSKSSGVSNVNLAGRRRRSDELSDVAIRQDNLRRGWKIGIRSRQH